MRVPEIDEIKSIDDVQELELDLSTICNAHCPLCYRNYRSFPECYYHPYIRPYDEVVKQLDTYKNLNYVMLVGAMSEPTLYPRFLDLVQYLKNRHVDIEICTNGDTRDKEFWIKLGELLSEYDAVYFTVCGCTQKTHEYYRSGTNLTNILKNAAYLRSSKPIDYAQCIRFAYNSDEMDSDEFNEMVSQFSHVYKTETFYPKDISNYKSEFNVEDFKPNKVKRPYYDDIKQLAELRYRSRINGPAWCQSLAYHRQQIDVFGNVYPCYLYLEASDGVKWDQKYDHIYNMNHPCCKFCDKLIHEHCEDQHLDYII